MSYEGLPVTFHQKVKQSDPLEGELQPATGPPVWKPVH